MTFNIFDIIFLLLAHWRYFCILYTSYTIHLLMCYCAKKNESLQAFLDRSVRTSLAGRALQSYNTT
jgi:hypothetical protein